MDFLLCGRQAAGMHACCLHPVELPVVVAWPVARAASVPLGW